MKFFNRVWRLALIAQLLQLCVLTTVSAAPLEQQIIVDQNHPTWLKYNGGGPHFLAGPGDPEDFLYRGARNSDGTRAGDQATIIAKLKSTGANSLYFQAIRSHGGDGDSTHNPFIDNDPSRGINNAVLDQWESWFQDLDDNGIAMYFFFYDDSASVWNTGNNVGAAERQFLEAIVNRFEYLKNIVWVVAEEYAEVFTPTRVSSIAAVIRSADDYDHVIAVHKNTGTSFSEFANDPNIDQFAIQLASTDALSMHRDVVVAWQGAAGRYNLNMSEAHDWGTGTQARKKAWAVAMGGAYAMVLGMDVVNTPQNDLKDLGHLVTFMESTNFNEMAPHDELAFGGTEYVLAAPGQSYIAYASNLSGKEIGLRSLSAGTYRFDWYDVITGSRVTVDPVSVDAGDQTWIKPSGIGNEVAVNIIKTSGSKTINNYFPGDSWEFKTPEEVGLISAKIDEFASKLGGDGCIVRNGYLVKCWGNPNARSDWASAAKPLYGTLLFFAIDEGRVNGVDDLISDWGWDLSSKDSTMSFRHLANMTSGYARGESPGTAWAYNDYAIRLYGKTLKRVFGGGQALDDIALDRMAALGFEDGSIFGSRSGYGVHASVRDFARIGWLWLNKGNWNGQQIVSRSHFDNYMKPGVPGNLPRTSSGGSDYLGVGSLGGDSNQTPFGPGIYGFNWWFNGKVGTSNNLHWPDAPTDTFQANGHWGFEVVTVIPSLNMVVAVRGRWGGFDPGSASSGMNQNLKLLVESAANADANPPAAPIQLNAE